MIKFKTLEEKDNPALKRKDLMLLVEHAGEATPKTIDVAKKIVDQFKTKLDNVEIVYLFSEKGVASTKVKARIWKEGSPRKVEVKEEKKEAPAEAEKPVEEPKKEEAPEDKKEGEGE
jgi:ribosomal protein S24E